MSKTSRRFIELDWSNSSSCLRAQDIPYDASTDTATAIQNADKVHVVSNYSSLPAANTAGDNIYILSDSGVWLVSDGSSWRFLRGSETFLGNDSSAMWYHLCTFVNDGNYVLTDGIIKIISSRVTFNFQFYVITDGSNNVADKKIEIQPYPLVSNTVSFDDEVSIRLLEDSTGPHTFDIWIKFAASRYSYFQVEQLHYITNLSNFTWYQNTKQSSDPTGATSTTIANATDPHLNTMWWKSLFTAGF